MTELKKLRQSRIFDLPVERTVTEVEKLSAREYLKTSFWGNFKTRVEKVRSERNIILNIYCGLIMQKRFEICKCLGLGG
jgi:hypothetical protein